ncbi:MAG: hypothetical protein JNL01_00370 [Bdellovibrionales bacterium]|nr:hypothetical protein [Bdellovibrionales bacterium]
MKRSKRDDRPQAHQSGDAWTAYSDLFTTLSVIFLMMFVFTLVRLTINSVQNNKEKKESAQLLEGKVPEAVQKKQKENKAEIAQSISEIQNYRNTIQDRMKEMNELVGGLEKHQKIVDELMKDQRKNEGAMSQMKTVIADRNKKIAEAKFQILDLSQKLVAGDELFKQKTAEAQALKQSLKAREEALKQARKEQADLNETLAEKDDELESLNEDIQAATQKVRAMEIAEKQKEKAIQAKIDALKSEITSKNAAIEQTQKQMTEMKQELLAKDQQKVKEVADLKKKIDDAAMKVAASEKTSAGLQSQLRIKEAELKKAEADSSQALMAMKGKLASLEKEQGLRAGEIQGLKSGLAAKTKALSDAEGTAAGLRGEIKGLSDKLAGFSRERGGMEKGLAGMQGKIDALGAALAGKEKELGGALALAKGLEGKLALAEGRILALSKDTQKNCPPVNQVVDTARAPAASAPAMAAVIPAAASGTTGEPMARPGESSAGTWSNWMKSVPKLPGTGPSTPAQMRTRVAGKIATRINGIDPMVKADAQTGTITLFFDEAFLFGNDQAKVEAATQAKLKKIIPIYSEELFGDEETRREVEKINIIGHASPRYGGKYIKPDENLPEAYYHNLQLSANRAINIVKYIFGRDFGDFKFKTDFRARVNAQGASFSQPISHRDPASAKNDPEYGKCGHYDCKRSRRVVISFELKGDEKR